MKKKMILGIVIVLIVLVFLLIAYPIVRQYIPEIPSRLAKYHNKGTITVTVDGKEIDLDGVELLYEHEDEKIIEKVQLKDGAFKFKKGLYGLIRFKFAVNEEGKEIAVDFGQINSNWWHVSEYDVDIQINTEEEKVTAKMNVGYTIEGDYYSEEVFEEFLDDDPIHLSVITGP